MKPKVTSWKGIGKGSLQTTNRFESMVLMEEISLTKTVSVGVVTVVTENWLIESEDYGDFVIDAEVINILISYRQLGKHDFEAGGEVIGCIRTGNIIKAMT